MAQVEVAGVRELVPRLRLMLTISIVLSLCAGSQLFLLPGTAERFFAWAIASPASAAFIGVLYLAASAAGVVMLRRREWAPTSLLIIPGFTYLVFILLATLLHLDAFFLDSGEPFARFYAWVWLIVYVVAPVGYLVAVRMQRSAAGIDRPAADTQPLWTRIALAAVGAVTIVVGIVLFVAPGTAPALWPWELTPLTGRMIGASLISIGVLAVILSRVGDWVRGSIGMLTCVGYAVCALIVVLRLADEVSWTRPAAWVYVVVWTVLGGIGVLGLLADRSARRAAG